jgi:SAM-dependent methyltransferase
MVPASAVWSHRKAVLWRHRWDVQQALLVPGREARFEILLEWLEALVGRRPRCLDLGCGTGALSERLLVRLPRARSVAVDFDPVLLRLGSAGLGRVGGRLQWVDADLRRPDWVRRLPAGRYDAAISSTALHWLTGPQLAHLYRNLVLRLRPGGVLLNADGIAFARSAVRLRAAARALRRRRADAPPTAGRVDAWKEWWRSIAEEPALRAELALRAERFPHEHLGTPTPDLAGHLLRLRSAGFREAEVVWSWGQNRILAAVR